MEAVFPIVVRYITVILMALYAFSCFNVFRYGHEEERSFIYFRQNIYMICIYVLSFLVIYFKEDDIKYIVFCLVSLIALVLVILLSKLIYSKSNQLIVNNLCMLLSIGFIMIARLSFERALRQFAIAIISILITSIIPLIISKKSFFSKFKWIYAIAGISALLSVWIFSVATNGAKISLTIKGITFQPSEFVKILFVFAMAGFLSKAEGFKDILLTTVIAAVHIGILVLSKDLGGAVILFAIFLCMIYVATGNVLYLLLGVCAGGGASVLGYKIFSHVRVRIDAFTKPFDTINNAGYQIAQSLFAIGTGGFFGMGIDQGMPRTIPVVASDFIFSAICEEFGMFFGICLILLCLSQFFMFMNIAMKFSNKFYKYVAVGLSIMYGFQVFLTIGGVTKFIPLTGVTLPLVSYGGTSVLVTTIMFSIIQGLYIGRINENNR